MADAHWYRNTDWNDEIAAAFEARLARARTQKSQYMRIQGQALARSHPDAAISLFERVVETGDEAEVAPAHFHCALAHVAKGDIDAALAALQAAIDQQRRVPWSRTGAALDYCFLVGYFSRRDHFAAALVLLGTVANPLSFESLQEAAARAMIMAETGSAEAAKHHAVEALALLPPSDGGDAAFGGIDAASLRARLDQIASAA